MTRIWSTMLPRKNLVHNIPLCWWLKSLYAICWYYEIKISAINKYDIFSLIQVSYIMAKEWFSLLTSKLSLFSSWRPKSKTSQGCATSYQRKPVLRLMEYNSQGVCIVPSARNRPRDHALRRRPQGWERHLSGKPITFSHPPLQN
jgi:hypothetical protein